MKLLGLLPRFRAAARAMPDLAAAEAWNRSQLQRFQLERLNTLWEEATHHVPYYRDLAATLRLPDRFDGLDQFTSTVPVLDKQLVRDQPDRFLSARHRAGRWRITSGSTGTPMRFYASHTAHQAMLRCQYRFRQMWGVDLLDPMVMVMGGAGGTGRARRASDWLRHRLRLPVTGLGPRELRGQLQQIARFRPAAIYGYSRAIHLLAREALDAGFNCDALRAVILTSEPVFPDMRATVERAFGVPAVVEYGATECGLIACEWPDRTLRVREDHVLVEAIPRGDGRGDVLLTVLSNRDFPLLRYRIEDVTDTALRRPDRGFAILGAIAGRNDDWLVADDGRRVHPAEVDAVFEQEASVRRYRVHQRADGGVAVKVELTPGKAVDSDVVAAAVGRVIGARDGSVTVEVTHAIEQTAAGKRRLITSDRAAEMIVS